MARLGRQVEVDAHHCSSRREVALRQRRSAAITLVTLFMCSSETIWSKLEGTKCQLGRKWRSQWPSTPSCMSTFEERP